jgi:hypothetical protein
MKRKDLEIRKVLMLVTNHLPEKVINAMAEVGACESWSDLYITYEDDYGVAFKVPCEGDWDPAVWNFWPVELQNIIEIARENGCDYIHFDADANPIEGLPVFEW